MVPLRPPGKRSGWIVGLFAGPLLLLGYLLGIGPAVRLRATDRLSAQTYTTIYGPLLWVCDRSPMIAKPVNWYVAVWIADFPGKR